VNHSSGKYNSFLANELLHALDLPTFDFPRPRLNRFTLNIVQQLTLQVLVRPAALFLPLEQWAELAVVGSQFIQQSLNISRCKIQFRLPTQRGGIAGTARSGLLILYSPAYAGDVESLLREVLSRLSNEAR